MAPVTVLIPTLNEEENIAACLLSVLSQDYPQIVDVFVIDGGSRDETVQIARQFGDRITVIANPRRTAAAAMNIGIERCNTEIFVRLDAHSIYAKNYVTESVRCLDRTGAAVAGGRMNPVGKTEFGRSVAAVTQSPLGVGPGRFHYSNKEESVDTVYLGTFRTAVVRAAGGFDERNLHRSLGEDSELNFRIRKIGYEVVLSPKIQSAYTPRGTVDTFAQQYFHYGMCKASILRKHKRFPSFRPLIPVLMISAVVLSLAFWALQRNPFWIVVPLFYILFALFSSFYLGKRFRETRVIQNFIAICVCHWAYGLGLGLGLIYIVLGRKFRPA